MSTPFSRTLRSLDADRGGAAALAAAAALLVLGAWAAWIFLGRVSAYEATADARLEVQRAVHPLASPVEGRVVRTALAVGRRVAAGEVLVEIDAQPERLALDEARARVADLERQEGALQAELRAEEGALATHAGARGASVEEARARAREAESLARVAESNARRLGALRDAGGVSQMEWERAQADAAAKRAAADAQRLTAERLEREGAVQAGDRRVRVAELRRELAEVQGARETGAARVRSLEHAAEARRLRAPVSGTVGEVAGVEPGAVVRPGERLGAVVPDGRVRAVARFPVSALGRIRPGQAARLRLDGFPWTEYGTLAARVAEVASEPSGGRIRVELVLDSTSASSAPIAHGLPADAEVRVDRASPFALLMRAAGTWGRGGSSSPASSDSSEPAETAARAEGP